MGLPYTLEPQTGLLCIIFTCSQKQFSRFQHNRHCPSRFLLDHNRIGRNESASQLQDIPVVYTPPLRHTYPTHRHKLNPRFRGDRFRCCPKEKQRYSSEFSVSNAQIPNQACMILGQEKFQFSLWFMIIDLTNMYWLNPMRRQFGDFVGP